MTELNNCDKTLWKRTESQLMKHISRCDFCGSTFSYSSKISNHNEISVIRYPINCKTYFCPSCALKKKYSLQNKLKSICYNNNMRFLTLTLSTSLYTPEQSLCNISKFFNLFCKELRRRKYKFQFFKIIEFTKKDIAHIHALISCYIPYDVIQSVWMNITHCNVVFIKKILNKDMLNRYLLKYLSKSISSFSNYLFYLLSKRRYSFSQFLFDKVETLQEYIFSNKFFNSKDEIMVYVKNLYLDKFFDESYFKIHFIT